jgi:hypothetical protein
MMPSYRQPGRRRNVVSEILGRGAAPHADGPSAGCSFRMSMTPISSFSASSIPATSSAWSPQLVCAGYSAASAAASLNATSVATFGLIGHPVVGQRPGAKDLLVQRIERLHELVKLKGRLRPPPWWPEDRPSRPTLRARRRAARMASSAQSDRGPLIVQHRSPAVSRTRGRL